MEEVNRIGKPLPMYAFKKGTFVEAILFKSTTFLTLENVAVLVLAFTLKYFFGQQLNNLNVIYNDGHINNCNILTNISPYIIASIQEDNSQILKIKQV